MYQSFVNKKVLNIAFVSFNIFNSISLILDFFLWRTLWWSQLSFILLGWWYDAMLWRLQKQCCYARSDLTIVWVLVERFTSGFGLVANNKYFRSQHTVISFYKSPLYFFLLICEYFLFMHWSISSVFVIILLRDYYKH